MAMKVHAAAAARQSADADHADANRSANADLQRWIELLREAMTRTGWTVDALAKHWDVDRGYVYLLVTGQKPWSVERMLSLPDDLEATVYALQAEAFGLIVVERVDDATARHHLATALYSLLAPAHPSLPGRGTATPAKATLTTNLASEIDAARRRG